MIQSTTYPKSAISWSPANSSTRTSPPGLPSCTLRLRLRGPRPEIALGADELARINQPVQLIWGDRDPFGTPEVGANAAKMIPDAELHVVPAGHIPWMSQADRIAELATPFLAAHLARPNSAAPPIEA